MWLQGAQLSAKHSFQRTKQLHDTFFFRKKKMLKFFLHSGLEEKWNKEEFMWRPWLCGWKKKKKKGLRPGAPAARWQLVWNNFGPAIPFLRPQSQGHTKMQTKTDAHDETQSSCNYLQLKLPPQEKSLCWPLLVCCRRHILPMAKNLTFRHVKRGRWATTCGNENTRPWLMTRPHQLTIHAMRRTSPLSVFNSLSRSRPRFYPFLENSAPFFSWNKGKKKRTAKPNRQWKKLSAIWKRKIFLACPF